MKKISINIQEPYYSFVLNGQKTIEGRLNNGKFVSVQVGDVILIGGVEFEVIDKNVYKSFCEMLEVEGVENVTPDKDDIDEAVDIYYKFYTKKQEDEFGVVSIKIKRIEKL